MKKHTQDFLPLLDLRKKTSFLVLPSFSMMEKVILAVKPIRHFLHKLCDWIEENLLMRLLLTRFFFRTVDFEFGIGRSFASRNGHKAKTRLNTKSYLCESSSDRC